VHNAGCRRWFNLLRDTATHRILAVYKIGEPAPKRSWFGVTRWSVFYLSAIGV